VRRVTGGPLAILLVALLLIGVAAALAARSTPNDADPSSRSAGDAGTLALYQWLSRLGLHVERMSGQFDPGSADVLVVADPTTPFTPAQASQVGDMVRGGGEVIVTTDRPGIAKSYELLNALGAAPNVSVLSGGSPLPASYDATVDVPIDPAGRVHRVPMRAGLDFDAPSSVGVPLLNVQGRVVGLGITAGSGRAYVLGSPYPLSNLGLRQGDSALFVLALLERARGGHVVFDEFHHGEAGSGGASAALSGPVGLAGGLAALAVFLFLLLSGRRLGRPVPARDPSRVPSATEYVGALGSLIERTAQRGGVATRYADELKRRVGAATAVDPRLDDEAFLALLERHDPVNAPPVRAALARCRELEAARPSGAQLLVLARQVDEVEAGFAVGTGLGLPEFRG
jgi:hypothetical protein